MGFELSKRKAYLALGLIVIVAVSGFVFYRYFMDWTGEASPKLKVIAKTDNSITLSWEELKTYLEEHDGALANYYLKMSTTGEGDPTFLHSETWTEIWNTSNKNVTSTTISDLSPNTDYWFYVAVNYHTYGIPRYGSNVIRTTTYPSLFQILITLAVISGIVAIALILLKKPK